MAHVSPTTTAATEDLPASEVAPVPADAVEDVDDLVEDVSIDGMCGVY
jgi:mycofactocin precursor